MLVAKLNWHLEEVGLNQIERRVMYSYIDTMVLDIRPKERHQSRWPAPDIEKVQLLPLASLFMILADFSRR
jgi:hypothetical protein